MIARLWIAITAAILVCTCVHAQSATSTKTAPPKLAVDIEAQPIRAALQALGKQTGIQVLFRSEDASTGDVNTPHVSGQLSVQEALDRLLANTGLKYEFINRRTVRISSALLPLSGTKESEERARLARAPPHSGVKASDEGTSPSTSGPAPVAKESVEGLETVIVTARKIREDLQKTPVSVGVFSDTKLQDEAIRDIADLSAATPSVVIDRSGSAFPGSTQIWIRGLGTSDHIQGLDDPVAVYVDDVYTAGTGGITSDHLYDVDHVEIAKGPQGTLFGRNSTGGAFSIFTKTPTDQLEGEVVLGAGNHDQQRVAGILNIPISDTAALRFVGDYNKSDGWLHDTKNNVWLGADESGQLRATLKLNPVPNLEVVLRADYTHSLQNGIPIKLVLAAPGGLLVTEGAFAALSANPSLSFPAALASSQHMLNQLINGPFFDTQNSGLDSTLTNVYGGSATIVLNMGESALKSITAIRRLDIDTLNEEIGAVPFQFIDYNQDGFDLQFSQELQLTGKASFDNRLQYAAGAYYYLYHGHGDYNFFSLPELQALAPGGTGSQFATTDLELTRRAPALYAQGTYALTDTVNVTGGLRETWESYRSTAMNSATLLNGTVVCNEPAPAGVGGLPCSFPLPADSNKLTYTFIVDWTPTEGVMLYAKTGTGYKSGGGQPHSTSSPLFLVPYKPETLTDYEVGVKSEWFDHRLRANIDYFHTIDKDAQTVDNVADPVTHDIIAIIQNVAKAKYDGVEAELSARPVSQLQFDLSFGYIQPKYISYAVDGVDLSHSDFENLPKWTSSIAGTYTLPTSFGQMVANLNWRWRSETDISASLMGPTPASIRDQGAYGLLNGTLATVFDKSKTTVSLWGRNLMNRQYFIYEDDFGIGTSTSLGSVADVVGESRTFGIELTKQF